MFLQPVKRALSDWAPTSGWNVWVSTYFWPCSVLIDASQTGQWCGGAEGEQDVKTQPTNKSFTATLSSTYVLFLSAEPEPLRSITLGLEWVTGELSALRHTQTIKEGNYKHNKTLTEIDLHQRAEWISQPWFRSKARIKNHTGPRSKSLTSEIPQRNQQTIYLPSTSEIHWSIEVPPVTFSQLL